jgi:aryl-alcohol dehydrogenase-like predicted oxidoreductase
MQFTELEGIRVSRVGLGTSHFCRRVGTRGPIEMKHALSLLELAFDRGVNFIDTADVYGSEGLIGQFARNRRDRLILSTKFGFRMEGLIDRRMIVEACNHSLRALKTTYVDLFQVHSYLPALPEAELLEAGDHLRRTGKIRQLGCSNYTPSQIAASDAEARAKHLPRHVSVQLPYSMLEQCPLPKGPHKPKVLAFRVFGGGLLAGKRPPPGVVATVSKRTWEISSKLFHVSRQLEVPAAMLALLWVLQRPGIDMALVGIDSESQLLDATRVFDVESSIDVLRQLNRIIPTVAQEGEPI